MSEVDTASLNTLHFIRPKCILLNLTLLTWRIWWYLTSASKWLMGFNPLNAELNPHHHLLALVGARHIVHVSRIRVNTAFKGLRPTTLCVPIGCVCQSFRAVHSHGMIRLALDWLLWNSVRRICTIICRRIPMLVKFRKNQALVWRLCKCGILWRCLRRNISVAKIPRNSNTKN